MKIQNNKTKAIVASLLIGCMIISSSVPILPSIDAQIQKPANAISIPAGGWITPLMTKDKSGNPITIHYVTSTRVLGYPNPVTCTTHGVGLYQEGGNWAYSAGSSDIGLKLTWTMPTGSVSGSTSGMYYNPVNFFYSGSMTGNTKPYKFFQVDWGNGAEVMDHWFFTMMYHDSTLNQDIYEKYAMSSVTESQGSTYTVQGVLESTDLSSTPSYVVQITLGTNGWISSQPLTYNPALGSKSGLASYQDEYLQDAGSTTLSADTEASPTPLADISGVITSEASEITGYTGFSQLNTSVTGFNTYSAFATNQITTKSFSDPNQCNSW